MQKTIDKYVGVLCEARKKKGLTEQQARDNLQDINVYGTLMVLAGDADGMVSGATTTTANTIRPALQVWTACCFVRNPYGLFTDIPFVLLGAFGLVFQSFGFWCLCTAAGISHAYKWSCHKAGGGVVSTAIFI